MNEQRESKTLPFRDTLMCQSFTSVPKTYIRAADELLPLSHASRLASLPSLSPLPFSHRHPSLALTTGAGSASHPSRFSPLEPQRPPRAIPQSLTKSLPKRQGRMTTEKNLDELAPLGNEWEKSQPGTGICGKCVLCLLLNAVFVLALFLAFLIGHFASEAHLPLNNKTDNLTLNNLLLTSNNATIGKLNQTASTLQNQTEIKQKDLEFVKNIERTRQTIKDVYPPQLYDSESFFDSQSDQDFALLSPFNNDVHHSNTKLISRSDYPLVPLPRIALPRHYNVDLDLTEFYGVVDWPRIRGNLSILLEAFGNATDDELLFNAGTNIFIQRIRLYRQTEFGKVVVEIKSVKRHIEREFVRLILGERLSVGWYWLYIEFNTRICQSELEGTHCFPGPLLSSDPKESSSSLPSRQLATGFSTKFEPNFARTFFPGWDDPSIRSTFNLSVQHFSDTNILFNTSPLPNKQNVSTSNLIKLTRFETTPPMPLYLFAIATGPFKPIQVVTTKTNLSLNIWSNNQDLLTAHFVANFSPIMFDKLQEDFNVKYPLSKLDIFITPKYPVGGMENWGLIILHSDNVRISNSDKIDKLAEKYKIEKLITHELIHQWFGNLVSIWNWEELWLSEGFTSYFVFDFLNAHNHPQLTEHEYYLKLIELINQQSTDGRSSLIKLITNSKQLDRLFDSIQLYTKGAVVVKMLKDLVGPEVFRTSIARFLRENSFQSVDRRSLWTAFPTNADHGADTIRLKDVMETWLLNKGIPEVEVKRNYEDKSIKLEQQQADKNRHLIYLDDDKMGRMRLNKRFKRMWQMEEEEEEDEIKKDEDINGILHWMLDGLEENNTTSTSTATTTTTTTKEIKRRKENNNKNVHLTTKKRQLRAERKNSQNTICGQYLLVILLVLLSLKMGKYLDNFDQYLLANPHWVYSYRVNYDILNWRMIITQLNKNHLEIPSMSRIQLIVDSEYFLRESPHPHLFVQLLSYLSKEHELGVLLVGLDALHSFLELFSASEVFGSLIVHLLPVILQLDKQLVIAANEGTDPEVAALWLLNPLRLAKLYQLRCSANLGTCAEHKQVHKWLLYPTALTSDNYQQLTAICHHLFKHSDNSELNLLSNLLKQPQSIALHSVIRHLSSRCVQDEKLIKQAVLDIINTRNAIIYSNSLKNSYTLNYNKKFREIFWTLLSTQLNIQERQILFAVNTGKSDRMARNLLHSVHSLGELNLIERILLINGQINYD
uniref:Uncharacterized protein n=1 Tax=Meloidogyne enterolobii TaxID=390850 RepID=A0A6V7U965_MELEN|nr:unnamed protein product [Meloidogyne enterolobii]